MWILIFKNGDYIKKLKYLRQMALIMSAEVASSRRKMDCVKRGKHNCLSEIKVSELAGFRTLDAYKCTTATVYTFFRKSWHDYRGIFYYLLLLFSNNLNDCIVYLCVTDRGNQKFKIQNTQHSSNPMQSHRNSFHHFLSLTHSESRTQTPQFSDLRRQPMFYTVLFISVCYRFVLDVSVEETRLHSFSNRGESQCSFYLLSHL